MTPEPVPDDLSAKEADELAHEMAETHRELAVAQAVGHEGTARADAIAAATGLDEAPRRLPRTTRTDRDWRRTIRWAVERRMYTPEYLKLYARYLSHRIRSPHVELQGLVFLGKRVELRARRGHGRLQLGPFCWIGSDNKLRAHEGSLRLGPKVVMGRDNVVNTYLDIEIGQNALMGDWIYICDFDHIYEHLHLPIKKQGLEKTPVRIGEDVWVGEKASILRGSDIGAGSVIASQALVKGHIPPFSIAVGSPARVIRSRLPEGMTVDEALDLQHRGEPIPSDPLDG
jgi:acetyltransferase-like isoleucine patch superfamily enzyme